jgi:predicted transcriptional regulator
MARRITLKQHLEDAELRLQRAQRRLDRQREAVAMLEQADRNSAKAKRYLRILEKAFAIHVEDRERLAKPLARPPR